MIILKALYFFVPAYFANMAPVFAAKIFQDFFSTPVDFGLKYKDMSLFGQSKTWRGLITAVGLGIIMMFVQAYLYNEVAFFNKISLIDYNQVNLVLFGFLLGFGAIFGDLIKSFFKRRLKLQSGAPWFPFDQIDFVLGGLLFISFVYIPSWQVYLSIIVISPVLHILTNKLGYALKLKKVAW